MGKNSKPILSVLVDEDKKEKFADLARQNKYSMGWLLNDCIDRMLAADSIDIYGEPARSPQPHTINTPSIDNIDIEGIVKAYIDSLGISSIDTKDVLTHQEVRDIAAATIKDSIAFERLCDEAAVIKVAEKLVNSAFNPLSQAISKLPSDSTAINFMINAQIEPLAESVKELETYTQNQFMAVREELKKPLTSDRSVTTDSLAEPLQRRIALPTTPVKTTDKDPSVKSWTEFFKMIGMDALTATQAQKKENIDTRTKQIEQGVQAAKEQGLGDWAVKVAGRSFVRVGD